MRTDRIKNSFRIVAFTAAAVAVLLLPVSCKDHDVYVENVIGMSAFHAGTRALVTNINDMGSQSVNDDTGFGVYGYKTKNSTNHTQIFTNQKVTATESGTNSYTWSYTPLKYWDMSAYYHYVAYWPHKTNDEVVVTHVINGSDHTLTLTIPNWQPAATGDDWMIATSAGNATSYFNRGNYTDGMVYFTFSHLLAQIEIQAWYYGNKDKKAVITDLTLGDNSTHELPNDAEGSTTTVSRNYATANSSNVWNGGTALTLSGEKVLLSSNTAELARFSKDVNGSRNTSDVGGGLWVYNETTHDYTTQVTDLDSDNLPLPDQVSRWLVVPFTTEDNIPLTVGYKVNGVVMPEANISTGLGEIESGKRYIIRLKINTNTNVLQVENVWVKDWDSQAIDKEVYNW